MSKSSTTKPPKSLTAKPPKSSTAKPPRPKPRLFLATPPVLPDDFSSLLSQVLAAADVACVLVWNQNEDRKAYLELAKTLVPLIQNTQAAALLRLDAQLVGRAGADGFHCDLDEAFLSDSIDALHPERIVGAANLRSKHDAMAAGELNADYVFFGKMIEEGHQGSAADLLLERAQWWQEIFETPCIVYAQTLEDVQALAVAGADFVALREAVWQAPQGAVSAIAQAQASLDQAFALIQATAIS